MFSWNNLPKSFSVLAPLDGYTTYVFREIISLIGKPDVLFTEFINVDGLISPLGFERVSQRLLYSQKQRPIIAQLWGSDPNSFEKAAKIIQDHMFDGIDINMGCPNKTVMKIKSGAALINDFDNSKNIIEATRTGAPNLLLSVKSRLGQDKILTNEWYSFLLEQKLDAITVHGRVADDDYSREANWQEIRKVVDIRNNLKFNTVIIGNGDIGNYQDLLNKCDTYKTDGGMVGRGIFSNPWLFLKDNKNHEKKDYIDLLKKHLDIFQQTPFWEKDFNDLKKFIKIYISNFPGSGELRINLYKCKTISEIIKLLNTIK